MIGEWVAQNPGEAIGIGSTALGLAGWLLVKWLGDKFEPKRPELSEKQKAEEMERLARSVLSTPVIREFAESTVTSEYRQGRFYEAVSGVVKRDKSTQEFIDGRAKHVFASHESAMRILISDAVRGVGAELQKQLSDSQALFMSELRAMRTEMSESIKAVADRVTALDTDLQVHEAEDRAKK